MRRSKRIIYFIQGIMMLISVFIMLVDSEDGYHLIVFFMGISLFIYAINQLLYFITLARYMVGGGIILLKALVVLDFAIGIGYLTTIPEYYVMIYLLGGLLFSGLVDVLRALETRKKHGQKWKIKITQGITTIAITLFSLFFINSTNAVIYIFCLGVVSSAFTKLTEAFRQNSIIYIS